MRAVPDAMRDTLDRRRFNNPHHAVMHASADAARPRHPSPRMPLPASSHARIVAKGVCPGATAKLQFLTLSD